MALNFCILVVIFKIQNLNFSFLQRYIHGEPIYVHITMGNQSTRAVKKLRLSVKQVANICLFSNAIYKCTVASVEHEYV